MNSLLVSMDNQKLPSFSRKRKTEVEVDFGYRNRLAELDAFPSSDGLVPDEGSSGPPSDDSFMSPKKKFKAEVSEPMPALQSMALSTASSDAELAFDDIDMAEWDMDDFEDDVLDSKPVKMDIDVEGKLVDAASKKRTAEEQKKLDDTPAWLSVYDSLTITADENKTQADPAMTSRLAASNSDLKVVEEDGSFRFFWLDYLEHEGKLYFIGKTQDKVSRSWVSCCITIENMQRNLFVLPRKRRLEQDEETGEFYETDKAPDLQDVYKDFDLIRKKLNIKSWKSKFVKRSYAFGEKDVPTGESQWLKVVYGFNGNLDTHL